MEHNIIIDKELSIHPVDGFDYVTQNSVGTKKIVATLDSWALSGDETLFIAFEKNDGSNKIDPILLEKCVDGSFITVIPREVICEAGDWAMCVYKKLNWNEEEGSADCFDVGKKFEFSIGLTISDESGKAITQYDLVNATKTVEDSYEYALTVKNDVNSIKDKAVEAAASAGQAKADAEAAGRAAALSETNAASSADAANSFKEIASEKAESAARDAQTAVEASAEAVRQAGIVAEKEESVSAMFEQTETLAAEAENSANTAAGWAAKAAELFATHSIKISTEYATLEELPEEGNSQTIYFIPNGGINENSFDEYVWVGSKRAYEKIGSTEVDLSSYVTKTAMDEQLKLKVSKNDPPDSRYAPANHNHDEAYSQLDHNHDTSYASLNHNHDGTYSKMGHSHPSDTTKANLSGAEFTGNISAPDVTGANGVYDGGKRVYSENNPPPKNLYKHHLTFVMWEEDDNGDTTSQVYFDLTVLHSKSTALNDTEIKEFLHGGVVGLYYNNHDNPVIVYMGDYMLRCRHLWQNFSCDIDYIENIKDQITPL